jgi:hypothetical protein
LKKVAYFSRPKSAVQRTTFHHTNHHKFTTIYQSKNTVNRKNPLQKPPFTTPDFFPQNPEINPRS